MKNSPRPNTRRKLIVLTLGCASLTLFALAFALPRTPQQVVKQANKNSLVAASKSLSPHQRESEHEFNEVPAEKWIENLPASTKLNPAPKPKSVKVSLKAAKAGSGGRTGTGAAAPAGTWVFRGTGPIPNGQTNGWPGREDPISGRIASIAIDPTNENIVYAGAASGGLYRSTDGGASWVQLMDAANTPSVGVALSIGAVAVNPADPSVVFVGTGEGNLASDSFFGSGFYVITGANGATPVVNGPYNANSGLDPIAPPPAGTDVFTGRSIVAIAVDPSNANNVYVTTSSGIGGFRAGTFSVLPRRGLYRSQNALSATPTWTRLQVGGTASNTIASSCVLDPQNPNTLIVSFVGQAGTDPTGVYKTTNATAATPTFTQSLALPILNAAGDLQANSKLAAGFSPTVNGGVTVVYATSSENLPTNANQGRLYKSIDAGSTFTAITAVDGFAGGQGFYDIAVGTDPNNPNNVSVGGQANQKVFERSTDGGLNWTIDPAGGPYVITLGLHADVHAIAYAKTNGSVIYHGNDGGIWRSNDGGDNWVSKNTAGLSAAQYWSLATHPTDPNFSIGGTQDNGTQQLRTDGSMYRIDFGDGGYALIDQNAPDTTNVVQYHTYYNAGGAQIGTGRVLTNPCAQETQWTFHGIYGGSVDPTIYCDGTTDTFNGIDFGDNVQFYAPMTLGPGNPNTWYFGTDTLYRSTDRADTAAVQVANNGFPSFPGFMFDYVNDIAVSAQDDNVRLVGTNGSDGSGIGAVWASNGGNLLKIIGGSAGGTPPITNGPGALAAAPVNKVFIDPNNKNIGYVAFSGFGTGASPIRHLWKITNLDALAASPTGPVYVVSASTGLPDVPINAIAIDPQSGSATRSSTDIYVATDYAVYKSTNGGNSWAVYGTGYPRVPGFGMRVQDPSRTLRVATHGRGIWDTTIAATAPTGPTVLGAFSRMSHGAAGSFDINLPLTGTAGTECRLGGSLGGPGNYTVVVRFTNTLAASQATATIVFNPGSGGTTASGPVGPGTGSVNSVSVNGTDLIVGLTNVSDVQTASLSVSGVTDVNALVQPATQLIPITILNSDVANTDHTVNIGDITAEKTSSGTAVTANNFRRDINLDGVINIGDITAAKLRSGDTATP